MFLLVMELTAAGLILVVFWSQIFIPLVDGTELFPIFQRERRLEERLTKERQKTKEKIIQERIDDEKAFR